MSRKKIKTIQTVLLVIVVLYFINTAYCLLTNSPSTRLLLLTYNMEAFRDALLIINLIIALTLFWKPTRMIGSLIATAYLGGSIALMIENGFNPVYATIALVLVWIIHKLSWWSAWRHTCDCECKMCSAHHGESTEEKSWCDCRPGCVCEKGTCTCK